MPDIAASEMPESVQPESEPLLVACLCAQWCGVCRDYAPVMSRTLATLGAPAVHPVWIDIEDDDEVVGDLDVQNFPTLLMLRGDTLCGSVSLVSEDAPALRHLAGPWLASLWIAPDLRRQGLGAMLVRHVIGHAHDHAIPMLRLFTPRNELWYHKLGWQREHAAELLGQTVIVMSCLPAQAIAAERGP